mmetsp:Transcript_19310/g.38936  ORF Transcript_19310/g.38936 Transcript_19310/m.38936 type:complete len:247 (-) Transcript_19310:380-1120(-)
MSLAALSFAIFPFRASSLDARAEKHLQHSIARRDVRAPQPSFPQIQWVASSMRLCQSVTVSFGGAPACTWTHRTRRRGARRLDVPRLSLTTCGRSPRKVRTDRGDVRSRGIERRVKSFRFLISFSLLFFFSPLPSGSSTDLFLSSSMTLSEESLSSRSFFFACALDALILTGISSEFSDPSSSSHSSMSSSKSESIFRTFFFFDFFSLSFFSSPSPSSSVTFTVYSYHTLSSSSSSLMSLSSSSES